MAENSGIEWTTHTWNPWRGCDKVSPGCAHCYMFSDQRRFGLDPTVVLRSAPRTFQAPLSSTRYQPGSMVFTCSWSDWFHPGADAWRDEAWAITRLRTDLTFQILTKRPERILEHLPADWGDGYPNVWLGVTIENRRFVHRADLLRQVPAAVRFISAEPLLGPLIEDDVNYDHELGGAPYRVWGDSYDGIGLSLFDIDWVIAGGESGPKHRPMKADWVRALRDECFVTRTAFFFKQWGGPRSGGEALLDGREHREFPRGAMR